MTPTTPAQRAAALVALLCAALGIGLAILLLREHLTVFEGDVAGGLFCGGGGRFDCNTVAADPSAWWAGYPVAMWGVLFYTAMAALAIFALALPPGEAAATATVGVLLALTAVLLDVWLGTQMVTRIGAVCLNCVASYVLNVVLAISFWRLDRSSTAEADWRGLLLGWWPLAGRGAPANIAPTPVDPASPTPAPPPAAIAPPARPGRAGKLVVAVLAIAGMIITLRLTGHAVSETLDFAHDEAQEFMNQYANETPLDMAQFDDRQSEGPRDARVQIVVFGDFECSFCRALSGRVERLRAEYPNDLRVIFVNAPINADCNPVVTMREHRHACWLAKAGICAAEHGKFWEYHRLVYEQMALPQLNEANVRARMASIGIPADGFDACVASAECDSVLARDVTLYRELEIKSVPSLIINGHLKQGGIYPSTLRAVVRAILAERN